MDTVFAVADHELAVFIGVPFAWFDKRFFKGGAAATKAISRKKATKRADTVV